MATKPRNSACRAPRTWRARRVETEVLRLAARRNQTAEALTRLRAEHPIFTEQQAEGGEDRPAHDLRHIGDPKRHVTRGFARRRIDQTHRLGRAQQPRRNVGFA